MNNNEKSVIVDYFRNALEKQYVELWEIDDQIQALQDAGKRVPRELSNTQNGKRLHMSSWLNVIESSELWEDVYRTDNWWRNLNNKHGGNRT